MAKFKPGDPRPVNSGRKKGTPNRRSFNAQELAERLGVDPLEVLLHATNNNWQALGYDSGIQTKLVGENAVTEDTIPITVRITAAKEAAQYLYSKRRAVEHTGQVTNINSEPLSIEKILAKIEKGEI